MEWIIVRFGFRLAATECRLFNSIEYRSPPSSSTGECFREMGFSSDRANKEFAEKFAAPARALLSKEIPDAFKAVPFAFEVRLPLDKESFLNILDIS